MYSLRTIKTAEGSRDSLAWAYFYARSYILHNMEGGKEKESRDVWQKAIDRFMLDRDPAIYSSLYEEISRMNAEGRGKEALEIVTGIATQIPPSSFSEQSVYHMALTICYSELRQFKLAEMHLAKADSMETK